MRHGFEYWESFWKWLKTEAEQEDIVVVKWWLKNKKAEFEEKWKANNK